MLMLLKSTFSAARVLPRHFPSRVGGAYLPKLLLHHSGDPSFHSRVVTQLLPQWLRVARTVVVRIVESCSPRADRIVGYPIR